MILDSQLITGERKFGKVIKVLVLGKNGMLGSMVFNYLFKNVSLNVTGTERNEFNAEEFLKNPSKFFKFKNFDYIINCIGIIKPYCKDNNPEGIIKAIKINSLFPHALAEFYSKSNAKIIQIATDCVFSGKTGNYDETAIHDPRDVYGKTKSLGEVLSGNFLNVRCSIIGPEPKNNLGLLGWFLDQKQGIKLKGYANHKWNGVTTLQFAKLCEKIIVQNKFSKLIDISHVFHFTPNEGVSKYQLLLLFKKIFRKKVEISKEGGEFKNLTLTTKYKEILRLFGKSKLNHALIELENYCKL